jgi:transcriptional enhancer factor
VLSTLLYISELIPPFADIARDIPFCAFSEQCMGQVLMDLWHTTGSAAYQIEGGQLSHPSGVLTVSSGNTQSYPLESKEGVENLPPFPSDAFFTKQGPSLEPQFPIPRLKLGSNLPSSDKLLRLQARRQSRDHVHHDKSAPPGRSYLRNEKYVTYVSRARRDMGKDGKPVWDSRVEAAFHNGRCYLALTIHFGLTDLKALVNIPPLGRKKKSQRGKICGRNELIAEWIYQETGEVRDRKQISSHIQVLKALLGDIPECE